jgi:flagella basal body P-ring formation protein FlgA
MMIKQRQLKIFFSFICLYTFLYVPVVVAGTYQSHKSIYKTARIFIRSHVALQHEQTPEIKTGKLDSRLKLKQCNKKLRAFLPKGSREIGKITVGVKCSGSNPWSLHVPVTISVYKNVLVSARQIQKGTVLTASDLKLAKYDLAKLSYGYFEDVKDGIGMKLKRRAAAGAVLTAGMLKKPQIIKRGQIVTIMAQSGSMRVRMTGKALGSGAIGDRIKVMNIKSSKKLEGIITLNGEVKVEI